MKFVLLHHCLSSRWDHGNTGFLRSIARTLARRGHEVVALEHDEPADRDVACDPPTHSYRLHAHDLDETIDDADVVIVHESSDLELIRHLGRRRIAGGRFRLLFYDAHHRALTAPDELDRFDLEPFDAVLAGGEILREAYLERGWGRRVVTWHEAADATLFKPQQNDGHDTDVAWFGNWADKAGDNEFDRLVIQPVATLGLRARLYGLRCPGRLRQRLHRHAIAFEGWIPDQEASIALSRARVAIDIPHPDRRRVLPGVPTSRMFEALACGAPLLTAPWNDTEGLLHAGSHLTVADSNEAAAALLLLMEDRELAAGMAGIGLCSIQARHTCEHRVDELLGLLTSLTPPKGHRPAPRLPAEQWIVAP